MVTYSQMTAVFTEPAVGGIQPAPVAAAAASTSPVSATGAPPVPFHLHTSESGSTPIAALDPAVSVVVAEGITSLPGISVGTAPAAVPREVAVGELLAAINVASLQRLGGADRLLDFCDSELSTLQKYRTSYKDEIGGKLDGSTLPNTLSDALNVCQRSVPKCFL